MYETLDSAGKKLSMPEIILYAVQRAKAEGEFPLSTPVGAVVTAITAEMSMPNTDVKQIGNTVFVSHFSKDKTETATRAFNKDSARNFVNNSVAYATGLAESGVKRMTVDFKGESIKQMLMAVAKSPVAVANWGMQIFKTADGGYRAYVNLNGAAR